MGDSGTGKTYALRTLVDAGITPFVFFLDMSERSAIQPEEPPAGVRALTPIEETLSTLADLVTSLANSRKWNRKTAIAQSARSTSRPSLWCR